MKWERCPRKVSSLFQCTLSNGHYPKTPCRTSELVGHASRELTIVGEDPEIAEGLMEVISSYADMQPSGSQHAVFLPMLTKLLNYEPLSPITDDPAEWESRSANMWGGNGKGVWQNIRNPKALSEDGGATYHLVGSADWNEIHYSKPARESEIKTEGGDENGGDTGDGDRPDASASAADCERSSAREPGE